MIDRTITSAEQRFGVPDCMAYLRKIAAHSRTAFLKFMLFMPLASHRKALPPAPYHLARIVAAQHRDCGECVQMEINEARQRGVSAKAIRAVLHGKAAPVPEGVSTAVAFAHAVMQQQPAGGMRHELRDHYGEEGVSELSVAIATAAFFPTIKRAMGFGETCTLPQLTVDHEESVS